MCYPRRTIQTKYLQFIISALRRLAHWLTMRIILLIQSTLQLRFVRDTLTLQAGQFILIFALGGTQAIIARVLGSDGLGDYRAVIVLFGVVGLLDISGSILVARTHLARAFGANDTEAIRDTLAYFLKINAIINGLLVVVFFVLFPILDPTAGLLARWLVITEISDVPIQMVGMILAARRDMRQLVRLDSMRLIGTAVLMIGVALIGKLNADPDFPTQFPVEWSVTDNQSIINGLIAVQVITSLGFAAYATWRYTQLVAADERLLSLPSLLERARRIPFRKYLREGVIVSIDKNFSGFTVETLPFLMLRAVSTPALGLFTVAYSVTSFPGPLISGLARNLDTYLPFKSGQNEGMRQTFIRATIGSGAIWALGTLALAVVGPFVLVIIFGLDYLPAVGWIYPLLLQSLAVGLGVGLGSALRTLGKAHYSILESAILTAILAPIGYVLIQRYGGYGAAWFVGLAWLLNAVAGIGLVLWFTRKRNAASK